MKPTDRQRWLSLLLVLMLALSLAAPALAAEGGGGSSGSATTEFSFRDHNLSFDPGGGDSVVATVHNATSQTRLEWKSSDETVLEVDYDAATLADTAYFNPLKPGKVKVTVKALDSGFTDTLDVTVNGILLLKGNSLSVPENGTVIWTRGQDFERYGTAAEESSTIALTSDKNNVSCRTMQDGTKEQWVFNGIRQGNATVTAQARTAQGANAGSPVEIRVAVAENTASTIVPPGTYSASNPLRLSTLEAQIAAQCREMIQDANNNLVSVSGLTVDTKEGTLYLGYTDADNTGAGVGTGMTYYVSTSSVGPYLKDIVFVPNPRFTGDKATITFTGNSSGGRTFKGKISVSVTKSAGNANLTLSTAEGTPLKLTSAPFSTAFQQVAGAPLHSVVFSLPTESQGTLYRDYINASNYAAKVTANDRFTLSELSRVTFVPADGYVGAVVIGYAGYTAAGMRYNGQLTVTVKQSVDGVITYYDGGLGQATFKEADFEDYSQRVTGAKLGWVCFALPASSQGTLYYNYGQSDASQIMAGDTFPYQGTPNINFVTMVPADGFSGLARVNFTGANESGASFSGTVEVHFQSGGGMGGVGDGGTGGSGMDVVYTCLPGSSVKLAANDFNNLCQRLTGQRLHYITFQSLPDHTLGALYHNRTTANVIGNRVTRGTKYYNSASPYLMNLSFWATATFHGDVEIPFTGASVSGQTFSGSLIITTGSTHNYNATISYSTAGRSPAVFVGAQFDTLCRTATNSALNYIRFTSLPTATQGNVYFDYQRAGTPATITTSDSFYLSGEQSVSRLSFLPAPGFTGTVSMPFTGWSIAGMQFQGTVQVNVTGGVSGTTIVYTTSGSPVQLSAYDFSNQGGGQPVNVSFTRMPYESQGKLYYQYTNPTHFSWLATAGMQYGFSSDPLVANLTFIPKAGYQGTVTIPYTAVNTSGGTYTGEIQIAVEPSVNSKYFRDLTGQSAATVSAVDFLYSQGVVNGVRDGQYAPASNIRRGDFCLMLYRAFQFDSDGTTAGFRDVPDSAYYAQAVNVLRSHGIVKGTGGNTFQPSASISRQDAALMVQRTFQAAGLEAADGTEESFAGYSDANLVDAYARGAVSGLLQQGIMPTRNGSISPRAALTRADMALLLHRAIAR